MNVEDPPEHHPGRVRFADVQRPLSLFAEGLAGRFIQLTPSVASPPGTGREPTTESDGASIQVPNELSPFPTEALNRGAYRVAVLHQLGYLEHGTYAFDLTGFIGNRRNPALAQRVFATLEDLRIDTIIRRQYPGARFDIDRVLEHARSSRRALPRGRPLASLLEALVQFSLGADVPGLNAQDETGWQHRMLDVAATLQVPGATVHDTGRVAAEICRFLEELDVRSGDPRPETTDSDADADADDSPAPPTTGADGQSNGADVDRVDLSEDDLNGTRIDFRGELSPDPGQGRGVGDATDARGESASQTAPALKATTSPETITDPTGPTLAARRSGGPLAGDHLRTYFYREWDYRSQSYLPDWCRLHEHHLRGEDYAFITGVRRRHALLAGQVKRHFGAIRPEAWHRVHRTPDGDELSLDSVVEAVIDRRSGHATDEHLYVRRDRAVRDVAAAFLLDMSRSTDSPVPDPAELAQAAIPSAPDPGEHDPYLRGGYFDFDEFDLGPGAPKRRVIDVAKESLAVMCDALQTLGDSHAIFGFSGSGRHNVEFHVAKEFSDRTSSRTWAALAAMEPIRYTRMGPPIRHTVTKLAAQPERTKVLVVVTDGYPQDEDYGPDRNDRNYGIHDTARALEEAEAAGIATFCVTVDPAGHDYLRRMCAADRYLVISDVNALASELEKVYRSLTGR